MTLGRHGPRMGRRIRQMTASAGMTYPRMSRSLPAFSQARGRLALLTISEVFTFGAELVVCGLIGWSPTG